MTATYKVPTVTRMRTVCEVDGEQRELEGISVSMTVDEADSQAVINLLPELKQRWGNSFYNRMTLMAASWLSHQQTEAEAGGNRQQRRAARAAAKKAVQG